HVLRHHGVAGDGGEAAVGAGDDARRVAAHDIDEALDPVGHHLGVLHVVGGHVDHAGDQDHATRRRVLREDLPVVLMAGVGGGEAQGANLCPGEGGAGGGGGRRLCGGGV